MSALTGLKVIKYDGSSDGKPWLIYKYPEEKFILGSVLNVGPGQEALFCKNEKDCSVFGKGSHTLCTGNLPLLYKWSDMIFDGDTPFIADLYFINKTVRFNMKWGTTERFPIEDPEYNIILELGAKGQYAISIVNSKLFVEKIVGRIPQGRSIDATQISRSLNTKINYAFKPVVAKFVLENQIPYLEITRYLDKLSEYVKENLQMEFEAYGMCLEDFVCDSISTKSSDLEVIKKDKQDLALGIEFYEKKRMLNILEKCSSNTNAAEAMAEYVKHMWEDKR